MLVTAPQGEFCAREKRRSVIEGLCFIRSFIPSTIPFVNKDKPFSNFYIFFFFLSAILCLAILPANSISSSVWGE